MSHMTWWMIYPHPKSQRLKQEQQKSMTKICMYYKLGQACVTNWGSFILLQIRANVVTNWGSYYKLGQPLLQNRVAITNWGKIYYKLGQVLQIRAIITNWGITGFRYGKKYILSK